MPVGDKTARRRLGAHHQWRRHAGVLRRQRRLPHDHVLDADHRGQGLPDRSGRGLRQEGRDDPRPPRVQGRAAARNLNNAGKRTTQVAATGQLSGAYSGASKSLAKLKVSPADADLRKQMVNALGGAGSAYRKAASEGKAKDRAGYARQGSRALSFQKPMATAIAGFEKVGYDLPSGAANSAEVHPPPDAQEGPGQEEGGGVEQQLEHHHDAAERHHAAEHDTAEHDAAEHHAAEQQHHPAAEEDDPAEERQRGLGRQRRRRGLEASLRRPRWSGCSAPAARMTVIDVRPLRGGWTSEMHAVALPGGRFVVLREMLKEPWRTHAVELLTREAQVLELLAATPVPAPGLVAVEPPWLAMTLLPGALRLDAEAPEALARTLLAIHAIDPPRRHATTTTGPTRSAGACRTGRPTPPCGSGRSRPSTVPHRTSSPASCTATSIPATCSSPVPT